MKNSEKQRILLFDMDLIAYRSAAAAEQRSVEVIHKASSRVKEFKTRTEFKEFLSEKNFEYKEDDYEIKDIQVCEPDTHAYQIVKTQVNSITEGLEADFTECYVGGKNNFRVNLELPELYKGNRKGMLRPLLLDKVKEYALNKYAGGLIEGYEVDDHVVVRSHELIKSGHDPVIISLDKDCKGCVGTKYFNWTEDKPKIIEVPAFGYLLYNKEKKKVEGLGLNFYCYQLLRGDPSDNYTPSDLHKQRFGDMSVVNLLKDCKTVNELFTYSENKFKEWFPEPITYTSHLGKEVTKDYKQIIDLYHQCAYMKRIANDSTTFYDLWDEFKND